jgi:2,4-dienoyl-CoA reductase-like NADH-dependent reductase (Old Yellow Enzyme family)
MRPVVPSGDVLSAFHGEARPRVHRMNSLRRLDRGDFDMVAPGRGLPADPGWARKIHEGRFSELQGLAKAALAMLS